MLGRHPGGWDVCLAQSAVDVGRGNGCLAPTLTYATSEGLSGVVRAAVEAKGRVPS